MGFSQEAYDAECAAIARALAVAAERSKLGRVRIFTDAHAAITRMTHGEPGPCPSGEEGDSSPARAGAFCRGRDPLVPRTKMDPWERDGPSRPPASRTTAGSSG